jgi:hypothetical protein
VFMSLYLTIDEGTLKYRQLIFLSHMNVLPVLW